MQSLNDEFDIRLFSQLIETILCCRLGKKSNLDRQIGAMIGKLQSQSNGEKVDLNFGIQMLSKLHEGSNFYVSSMMKKHFLTHEIHRYSICLEIFTFHNKRQQLQKSGKQDKNKLTEKWIFSKQQAQITLPSNSKAQKHHTDLIFKVLHFIRSQNASQNQENGNPTEINNNTTAQKGYQLVLKSYCPKKRKNLIHVLHLEKSISQLQVHTQSLKSSLLDLPNFWGKSMHFFGQSTLFVGCYFYKLFKKEKTSEVGPIDYTVNRQPDRKMSSETKAEQKESTCSFKFSLENFSFRLSGNKHFKQSSDVQPIRKTSAQIANLHRPRYQSIYESKDEEMNIFILSPRKLSEEESPKVKHLQQKPIQFEILDQKGISEEMIEEFVLEQDDFMSNTSSEGFEMLEENDQLDSICEERSRKELEREVKQRSRKQREVLKIIDEVENDFITLLKTVEKNWLLSA